MAPCPPGGGGGGGGGGGVIVGVWGVWVWVWGRGVWGWGGLCGGYVFPAAGLNEILTFKIRFDLEGQGQLPLKTIGILTKVLCTSGPTLVILAWMADDLWCGQAAKGVNMDF